MNLIELLKDNEKSFGLMSKEMQAKARSLGKNDSIHPTQRRVH